MVGEVSRRSPSGSRVVPEANGPTTNPTLRQVSLMRMEGFEPSSTGF